MKMNKQNGSGKRLTGRAFDALPAEEKERIYQEIDQSKPGELWARSRAPTAAEQTRLDRIAKKMGRPKIGKGVKIVSVSVEADLLKMANAYAKRAGIKRAELFTQALRSFLPGAASAGK